MGAERQRQPVTGERGVVGTEHRGVLVAHREGHWDHRLGPGAHELTSQASVTDLERGGGLS